MKIVLISNLYPPYSRGGAEKIVEKTCQLLKNQGYEVRVLSTCPFDGWKSLKLKEKEGARRFYPANLYFPLNDFKYPTFFRVFWHALDMFNIHAYFVVKRFLEKQKPDVVISHNLKGIGYLTPFAVKRAGIRHIHVLHDVQLDIPSGLLFWGKEKDRLNTFWLTRLYSKINKMLFKHIDVVVSPSEFLMDFYKNKGFFKNAHQKVIRNPVNLIPFDRGGGKWIEMNYLYLGQIEEHKGVRFLIETFLNYQNQLEDYYKHTLRIVGQGSLLKELRRQYAAFPEIQFYGDVDYSEIVSFFAKTDYLIFPSLCYENSPNVIGESLSFGVPVIVSRVGGASELVEQGKNGFCFTPGNQAELLSLLNYCKETPDQLEQRRTEARKSILPFTEENYLREMEKFFKS